MVYAEKPCINTQETCKAPNIDSLCGICHMCQVIALGLNMSPRLKHGLFVVVGRGLYSKLGFPMATTGIRKGYTELIEKMLD